MRCKTNQLSVRQKQTIKNNLGKSYGIQELTTSKKIRPLHVVNMKLIKIWWDYNFSLWWYGFGKVQIASGIEEPSQIDQGRPSNSYFMAICIDFWSIFDQEINIKWNTG